jgi:hypothetical protein
LSRRGDTGKFTMGLKHGIPNMLISGTDDPGGYFILFCNSFYYFTLPLFQNVLAYGNPGPINPSSLYFFRF